MRSPASPRNKDAERKRFFATLAEPLTELPAPISVDDPFVVHHLRTVMRARPGEPVVVVDDLRELAYEGTVEALEKHRVQLRLDSLLPVEPNQLPFVTLAVAMIKEQRWDWLLQKATELGVRAFQPLICDRSVVRLAPEDFPKKQERWQAVLRSAAEQSEGLFIPQLLVPLSVEAFCNSHSPGLVRVVLAERGEERTALNEVLVGVQAGQSVLMAIGPEGGWTDAELQVFGQAGFTAASLGSRILRSETAVVAAMAAVVYEAG